MNRLLNRILLLTISGLISTALLAQKEGVPKGWHLMDKQDSGYYGISMDKAYAFIKAKKLKSKTVVVAVLDTGVDTTHEDIKSILWHNPKEIAGNGIDDDKNGYVDDIYGWNFIGGSDGKNVEDDSGEAVRVYHMLKSKWEGKDITTMKLTKEEMNEYIMWKRAETEITSGGSKTSAFELLLMKRAYTNSLKSDSILRKAIGREKYSGKELDSFFPVSADAKKAKTFLLSLMQGNDMVESSNQEFLEGLGDYVTEEERKTEAVSTPPENYRGNIVKDNYSDFNDKFYGNSDVMASTRAALHGTHVSGIIGAVRNNGIGIDGVADNVRIMMVRMLPPSGDEHDKDVALAIRYAADNGAQVINMSFGKGFSPEKKWVDEAVKYAESKGVLLVQAAGNDSKDIDTTYNFPTRVFQADGKSATNWITVGASGDPKAGGLIAYFSNYGKKEVDVFAPGVKIYSSVAGGNTYQYEQGTSMASPVVAGVAAFILEYYPDLSAQQVKYVIEKSAVKLTEKIKNPETGEMVNLSDISKSGGLVNAYAAIKLASTLKGERNKTMRPTVSTVKPKVKG